MGLSTRATLETLALMVATFLAQSVVRLAVPPLEAWLFVLSSPLPLASPWTLVTSVYAHAGPVHLLGNALMLLLFGLAVEQVTSRWRYHAFFVVVGATAGVGQMLFGVVPFIPSPDGVLGASGAILGLAGYTITGNQVADKLVAAFELDLQAQLAALAAVGAAIALYLAAPGVANVGHFLGLFLGLLAGRSRLLHVESRATV